MIFSWSREDIRALELEELFFWHDQALGAQTRQQYAQARALIDAMGLQEEAV